MEVCYDSLEDDIKYYYSYGKNLANIYACFIQPVAKGINKKLLTEIDIEYNEKKSTNAYYLKIICNFFYHDVLRALLIKNFSPETRKICEHMTWWGETDKEMAENLVNRPLVDETKALSYRRDILNQIGADFQLFAFNFDIRGYGENTKVFYTVFLPETLRFLFKKSFDMPDEGQLKYFSTSQQAGAEKNSQVFENEKHILRELPLCQIFQQQKRLNLSQQGKPNKATLKKLRTTLECQEYYTDNVNAELSFLHTHFLALMTMKLKRQIESIESGLELLKAGYQVFNEGQGFSVLDHLMTHLQGRHLVIKYGGNKEAHLHKILFRLLKSHPTLKWINFTNWEQHIFLMGTEVAIVTARGAGQYLSFKEKNNGYSEDKIYLESDRLLRQAIAIPMLKSVLFLYASLGWVDIAYSDPVNTTHHLHQKDYLSLYDGLQCFRLTTLGAYILGKTKKYVVEVQESDNARVILDTERLLITFHGQDILKATVLKQMTQKVGDNRYKMDYESLLSGCYSLSDVKDKIAQFKQQIAATPPQNWLDFFQQVVAQAEPLKTQSTLQIFQLSQQKALYQLIATDHILKKYVLKAEAYHVLIEKKNLSAVKKRLLSLGYFMS